MLAFSRRPQFLHMGLIMGCLSEWWHSNWLFLEQAIQGRLCGSNNVSYDLLSEVAHRRFCNILLGTQVSLIHGGRALCHGMSTRW